MKKVLLLAALTMVATSAHASKARLAALQNATHLVDVQNDFDQPWQAGVQGELATVEFGTAGSSPNAEGGFLRAMGDGYLGAYLGHQPTALVNVGNALTTSGMGFTGAAAGTAVTSANAFGVANPINIMWAAKMGDVNWGANLYWENATQGADTATGSYVDRHSNMSGVSLGASNGTWDVDAIIGLIGKATTTVGSNAKMGSATLAAGSVEKFDADTTATLRGGWKMDNMYYYAMYGMAGGKYSNDTSNASNDVTINNWNLGAINSHKRDGVDFFYGLSISQTTVKNADTVAGTSVKSENLDVPLLIGVEAEANSWMVLRGSISQSLVGSNKITGAAGVLSSTTAANNTTIGAGAGFKFNKFTLDTFIAAAANGNVSLASDGTGVTNTTSNTTNGSGDKFLTQASLTYAF